MKVSVFDNVLVRSNCGNSDIQLIDFFDNVFGEKTLRFVHGDTVKVQPWDDNKRTVKFALAVNAIPNELKKIFCGDSLRITSFQKRTLLNPEKEIILHQKIRMHFLFAELFSVRPTFTLKKTDTGIFFSSRIEHKARLPIPLNMISEEFMKKNSEQQVETLLNFIRRS